jgi:hydroxymethylglutaryl-CoA synthase
MKPEDFDYCVFHMPNGKFPRDVARRLGFSKEQLSASLTVDHIGNPYSASAILGLAAVLDIAKPGEKIFMVSYGSGAGADAFTWETTSELPRAQKVRKKHQAWVTQQILKKQYVDYVGYLKQTHKI